ncbi:MAG: transporter [Deltaproteobacteria bacterium]|nr:transporter [Deltaproteobacteria bacterium]MBW2397368.1 transporter [Deltaproteobacteria bacterium]
MSIRRAHARVPILCALLGALISLALPQATFAAHSHAHHDATVDAPIGVMGDHLHPQGGVMLSYRYMRMSMNGNRDGTSRQSENSVHRSFPIAPLEMDMEAHMFSVMWAPHEDVTLAAMLPFKRLDMKHRTRGGRSFTTRSHGIGDTKFTALVRLFDRGEHHLHLNLGVSAPTGSISAKDDTPMGRSRLPYPMQLGSGTWDLLPGATYTGAWEKITWGSQILGTLRTGINRKGYRLGHRFGTTGWLGLALAPWVSTSVRLAYQDWRGIRGDDDDLNRNQVPTADPDLRAGRRLDLWIGLDLKATNGALRGHRLALEVGRPVYQKLDGPQLETDWMITVGWQKIF